MIEYCGIKKFIKIIDIILITLKIFISYKKNNFGTK
jgi:hypothetical protein